jgi:8-hydroxy-5-deazaflavin:NADPH oxidoreductase
MNIGIIGSGHVGSAIAAGCVRAGHSVVLTAQDPEHARQVAADVGVQATATNRQAAEGADVVILAVPSGAFAQIAAEIAEVVAGKTIIDVTNRLGRDLATPFTGTSLAEELQALLPAAHVVKAFNVVGVRHQADARYEEVQLEGFHAGDDEAAKAEVAGLLGDLGYHPVDVGPLAWARVLENMGELKMAINSHHDWKLILEWKLLGVSG